MKSRCNLNKLSLQAILEHSAVVWIVRPVAQFNFSSRKFMCPCHFKCSCRITPRGIWCIVIACIHYFLSIFYFSPIDSPLKTIKNVFLFHRKSYFCFRDIQVFVFLYFFSLSAIASEIDPR